MKRSLHGLQQRVRQRLHHVQYRQSTAFDPWHYLHQDTVKRDQSESFRRVWKNDIGDFKRSLTASEIEQFEERVSKTEGFDDFYAKMIELFSPRRHHAIRNTRTWAFTHCQLVEYLKADDEALIKMVFAEDEVFEEQFMAKYLSPMDRTGLLTDFSFADLRFMCAVQAIDIYGGEDGPKLSAMFGCRRHYHHNLPDPDGHSAHWINCLYDKVTQHDVVLITVLNAMKEGRAIDQLYFRDKLSSMDSNAMKDDEWRELAKEFMTMDTDTFHDKLDRAFVAFQTDEGVSELRPRFDSDID